MGLTGCFDCREDFVSSCPSKSLLSWAHNLGVLGGLWEIDRLLRQAKRLGFVFPIAVTVITGSQLGTFDVACFMLCKLYNHDSLAIHCRRVF